MALISNSLNTQLNDLIGKSFALNRMLDRGVSLLGVRWNLINISTNVHHRLAHAFPGDSFADSISDYQSQRNNESIYPATPAGDEEYNAPIDLINHIYNSLIDYENAIKDTVEQAIEEGDQTTKVFLDGLLNRLVPYIDMSQNLVDWFTDYGNDTFHLQMLDSVIGKYMESLEWYN